jgi:hypothetical protein
MGPYDNQMIPLGTFCLAFQKDLQDFVCTVPSTPPLWISDTLINCGVNIAGCVASPEKVAVHVRNRGLISELIFDGHRRWTRQI